MRLPPFVEVEEWELIQVSRVVVVQAIPLALLPSLLSHLVLHKARHMQTSFHLVLSAIKVLPKRLLEALSNLAVIVGARGTTFEVTFDSILWNLAVLVNFAFCVDTFTHLLNSFLLSIQFGGEDPIDKNAFLESSCLLVHLVRSLEMSHSHKFFSIFFDGLLEY